MLTWCGLTEPLLDHTSFGRLGSGEQGVGHNVDHPVCNILGNAHPQRQPQKPVAHLVCDGHVTACAAVSTSWFTAVQWNVVEYCSEAGCLHRRQEGRTLFEVARKQVVHVRVVLAVSGDDRPAHSALALERF